MDPKGGGGGTIRLTCLFAKTSSTASLSSSSASILASSSLASFTLSLSLLSTTKMSPAFKHTGHRSRARHPSSSFLNADRHFHRHIFGSRWAFILGRHKPVRFHAGDRAAASQEPLRGETQEFPVGTEKTLFKSTPTWHAAPARTRERDEQSAAGQN